MKLINNLSKKLKCFNLKKINNKLKKINIKYYNKDYVLRVKL